MELCLVTLQACVCAYLISHVAVTPALSQFWHSVSFTRDRGLRSGLSDAVYCQYSIHLFGQIFTYYGLIQQKCIYRIEITNAYNVL